MSQEMEFDGCGGGWIRTVGCGSASCKRTDGCESRRGEVGAENDNSAQRNTDRGASLDPMEMGCAECGCVVDRGVIVRACKRHPDCCCRDVPASPTR